MSYGDCLFFVQRSRICAIPAGRAQSREVVYRLIHRNRGLIGKGLNFQPVNGLLAYADGVSTIDGACGDPEIRRNE